MVANTEPSKLSQGSTPPADGLRLELRSGRSHHSLAQWSKSLKVNKNTLSAYEKGDSLPDVEFLSRYATETDTPFLWLLLLRLHASKDDTTKKMAERLSTLLSQNGDPDMNSTLVPTIDPSSLGNSSTAGAKSTDCFQAGKLSRSWLCASGISDPEKAAFITLHDDSMEPTIPTESLLLVDRGVSTPTNGVYVVSLEGAVMCKRVQTVKGGFKLTADNSKYDPIEIDRSELGKGLNVLAKVIRVWRITTP